MRTVKQEHKCLGAKPDYQANFAVAARNAKEAAEQKAQDNVADKISGPFDALASAAVAKAETIDNHVATITTLIKPTPKCGDEHAPVGATYRCQTTFFSTGLPALRSYVPLQPIWQCAGRVRKPGNCGHGVQNQHCKIHANFLRAVMTRTTVIIAVVLA